MAAAARALTRWPQYTSHVNVQSQTSECEALISYSHFLQDILMLSEPYPT